MTEFLSVSEFAEKCGKDSGNIRRLLSNGRLEGKKVGNQWIIPGDAVYPEDKRVKSGQYRNWRIKSADKQREELMHNICEMIKELSSIFGGLLYEVILYGSYARGTQKKESDVDIAVILHGKPDMSKMDEMIKCVSSYELKCGKVLSVIDIDFEKYKTWKDVIPFYKNVSQEGIVLWKETA